MLINATQPEEYRVALVDGQRLYDFVTEHPGKEHTQGNIYKGKITRIERSLNAIFVDCNLNRQCFLPFKEISTDYYLDHTKTYEDQSRPSVADVMREGQEIMVQVVKEERGTKGAALTTFISLAGCYLVLMPNNPRAGGISRRIEGDEREEMREVLSQLELPEGMGVIVRTAGVGKSIEELQWDLNILLKQWETISNAFSTKPGPFLIHQESDVVVRAIRDYLRREVGEVLIDNPEVYEKAHSYIERIRPDFINRVKLHQDSVPLFNRFQIEKQIESAFQREVRLPSGGVIVIDHTEALVAIDINSGKATKAGDIEETAFNTNLEAADEIARQLRLRDLGGLIVIDFIDMTPTRNQREVENRLREALRMDRARVQVGRITRFGLLEMSRQRLRPSLGDTTHQTCPRCSGQGRIRSIESLALSVLRLIEEDATKEKTGQIKVQVPVEVATYLLNEKRQVLIDIETRHSLNIIIIPNTHLESPQYKVERVRMHEMHATPTSSYQMKEVPPEEESTRLTTSAPITSPAVKNVILDMPPSAPKKGQGIIKRIISGLFSKEEETPVEQAVKPAPQRAISESYDSRKRHPQQRHRNQQRRQQQRHRGQQQHHRNRPNVEKPLVQEEDKKPANEPMVEKTVLPLVVTTDFVEQTSVSETTTTAPTTAGEATNVGTGAGNKQRAHNFRRGHRRRRHRPNGNRSQNTNNTPDKANEGSSGNE